MKTRKTEPVFFCIVFAGIILLFITCEKVEVNRVIKIETDTAITIITTTTAEVKGEILDIGETAIIAYGHCWSLAANPAIKDDTTALGKMSSRGVFTSHLNALLPSTFYYVRAYATDAQGTTYGRQINFKTLEEGTGIFADSRDGHVYKRVKIGSQVWMADNLAFLPAVSPANSGSRTDPIFYVFDYNGSDTGMAKSEPNYITYGVLYNWSAAMNGGASSSANPSGRQGICPTGWHLPSDAEWKQLEMFLGMSPEVVEFESFRGLDEGGKLKEAGYAHWYEPNTGADNSSGFTALPGGWRQDNGDLNDLGGTGCWWSATQYDGSSAWKRGLVYSDATIDRANYWKEDAFSVRCVRDN